MEAPNPRHIIETLREPGAVLPDQVREWLLSGFVEFTASGGRSLCQCLGLRKKGPGLACRERTKRRNDALLFALECIPKTVIKDGEEKELSEWARLDALASKIKWFGISKWPRVRLYEKPPNYYEELEKHLFMAYKIGGNPPETPQGLKKALNL